MHHVFKLQGFIERGGVALGSPLSEGKVLSVKQFSKTRSTAKSLPTPPNFSPELVWPDELPEPDRSFISPLRHSLL